MGTTLGRRFFRRAMATVGVAAVVLAGGSLATAAGASAADTSPPTEPGAITVSSVTSSSVQLKWGSSTDDTGIEGYRVYRGPASAADDALSLIATTDAINSFPAATLRSSYAYKFGVVAIDSADNKSPIRTVTTTTLASSDTTGPDAPSSGSVSLKAFSSTRIDVIYGPSSSSDVAYYLIYRNGVVVGTVEKPYANHYSDNGLTPSTSYSYYVVAVDSAGNHSAATSTKTTKTLATGTPRIARGPYLSNVTATSAVVSWYTNIATPGVVAINGQQVTDSAGSVQHHTVTISGLTAATNFPYTVTSSTVSGSGTLRTAANPGDTFSFAAIGDFGGGSPGETQNAANIGKAGTQFIQTLGDDIYPSAGLPDPDFTTTYSDFDGRFFKQFGPVVNSQAFMPANGNKEYYGDGEFWQTFPMLGTNHSWYSYDWGSAHILVLDSEVPFNTGSPQYQFAQADLAAHQNATWRIVALQRPPYSSTTDNSSSKPVQQYLVPLFQQDNVNLVLSGNSHNYERSYPLTNGNPVSSGGITYIVSGGGGNGFNVFTSAYPQPAYSAYRESSWYEYTKVTVSPTSITTDAIRADTNAVFDSTTITKSGADTTPPSAPTGLQAGTPTSNSVALSWTANPASDGVAYYNVYRNGTKVSGSGVSGTSYTDAGLSAATKYAYTVSAVDGAGNESAQSAPLSVTTAASTGSLVTLTPTDDITIDPDTADKPTPSRLKADASGPVNDSLLKFTAPASCTAITAATLKLTVGSGSTDPSSHGGDLYATSRTDPNAGWTQSTVTWSTAPAKSTTIASVALNKAVTSGTTYPVDVTTLVPSSGGTFTIRMTSTSADGAGYYSSVGNTGANAPTLVLGCNN